MKGTIDIEKADKYVANKIEKALPVLGAVLVTYISDKIRANGSIVTSNLINSITYSTSKVSGSVSGTDGTQLSKAPALAVHGGTTVVYGPRVEFGFEGEDSLGRTYHQPAKSFLRATLIEHGKDIQKLFVRLVAQG